MSAKYFYLMSSLPTLSLDTPPPLTTDQFRLQCKTWLTPLEWAAVEEVLTFNESRSANPFLLRWRDREIQLRNAIARQRAARLGVDPEPHLREHGAYDASTDKSIINAFARPTPIEREMELDRLRWRIVDETAGFDPYQLSGLLAYALKIRLSRRWAKMDEGRGRAALEELIQRTA
ncbi:MAG: hypothetical protein A3G34_05990 [Candidatus Lindowbacteria bacterium RIFCSPLOWO2_12_FULL_62_27]|nr:MAG: hypothetical protein A3G34_05990 [Candidatus Lindowbacteria bacterium RIFCSPLOWO2_12_FULL_62_27]OGH57474.1 MAG: hypothetical protein A3I06_06505 [Candidatus Lindowbacteria bacterium RIFCSPLOWO2_02_FULL_62_12]